MLNQTHPVRLLLEIWSSRSKGIQVADVDADMGKIEDLPKWEDMPPVEGMPHGCAWGLFDSPAEKDQLGTLNLLTPETTLRASQEIKSGVSVALNWGLEKLSDPTMGRSVLEHRLVDWRAAKKAEGLDFYCWDDEISINTQTGSQWDGLRHWGHSKTGLYYNGLRHSDIPSSSLLGIETWTKKGGLTARGVLLDYASYAARNNITYSPMTPHPITVPVLQAIAAEHNITFLSGDILLVRTGWTKWYDQAGYEERQNAVSGPKAWGWAGVKGCEETMRWLWDTRFAAVAGDSNGFEVIPSDPQWSMHDYLLSMFGMPIGEMWDLEALKGECERQGRWTFFMTSAPLNLKGGVASPPNAIAIF